MLFQLIVVFLIVSLLTAMGLRYAFVIVVVRGESMYPTLTDGDRLLTLRRWPLRWLRRNQIVVGDIDKIAVPRPSEFLTELPSVGAANSLPPVPTFNAAATVVEMFGHKDAVFDARDPKFVKRLTGLEGDTIRISIATLHELLQALLRSRCDAEGNLVWTIPPGHCFVRGDGLISMDSLILGPIPLSAITGIAVTHLRRGT